MRLQRIDKYLLLLAGLFLAAILLPRNLPGEEVLPDMYRAAVYRPLLAQTADALAEHDDEVVRLKSQLASAERELANVRAELKNAKDLVGFFRELNWPRPEAIPGRVFLVEADAFRRHIKVDVTSKGRVRPGHPVVVGTALVGLVLEVDRRQVTVRRVDDPGFAVEVEIMTGETDDQVVHCIARGDGDDGLELHLVARASQLSAGQKVYTSSYDDKIPPGLLVGTIEEVVDEDHDGRFRIRVRPAASQVRLSRVDVLRQVR